MQEEAWTITDVIVSELPKLLVLEEQESLSTDKKRALYSFPSEIVLFKRQKPGPIRYKLKGRVLLRNGHFVARVSVMDDVFTYDGMQNCAHKSKGPKKARIDDMTSAKQNHISSAWYVLEAAEDSIGKIVILAVKRAYFYRRP